METRTVRGEETVTAAQAAEMLGLAEATVRAMAHDGRLRTIPISGGLSRILLASVEEMLAGIVAERRPA